MKSARTLYLEMLAQCSDKQSYVSHGVNRLPLMFHAEGFGELCCLALSTQWIGFDDVIEREHRCVCRQGSKGEDGAQAL